VKIKSKVTTTTTTTAIQSKKKRRATMWEINIYMRDIVYRDCVNVKRNTRREGEERISAKRG